jgi:hypothetical protein
MCPGGNPDHVLPLPAQLYEIGGDKKSRWNGKPVQNLQAVSKENSKAVIKGQENAVLGGRSVLENPGEKVADSGKDKMILEEPDLFDEAGSVFRQNKMVSQDPVSPGFQVGPNEIPHPNCDLLSRFPGILAETRPSRPGLGERLPAYHFIIMVHFCHSASPMGFR